MAVDPRQTYIEKHYDELLGLVCDAATAGRAGSELSLWLRKHAGGKIRLMLGQVWDDAQPNKVVNGQPAKRP